MLGQASFAVSILLFQLLVATPCALVVLGGVASGPHVAQWPVLRLSARNPILFGCAVGLAISLSGWHPPPEVMRPFDLVGIAALPLVLGTSPPGIRPLSGCSIGETGTSRSLQRLWSSPSLRT